MKIYKAAMPIEGSPTIFQCDVIEYQSKFWLVPHWLVNLELGLQKPVRIILLDAIPHQNVMGSEFGDFAVNIPVSKDVLDGRATTSPNMPYVVIEAPDIEIRISPPAAPGSQSMH